MINILLCQPVFLITEQFFIYQQTRVIILSIFTQQTGAEPTDYLILPPAVQGQSIIYIRISHFSLNSYHWCEAPLEINRQY